MTVDIHIKAGLIHENILNGASVIFAERFIIESIVLSVSNFDGIFIFWAIWNIFQAILFETPMVSDIFLGMHYSVAIYKYNLTCD